MHRMTSRRRFSSINEHELSKFRTTTWWSPSSSSAAFALQAMHSARVSGISSALRSSPRMNRMLPKGEFSALDVGCGGGMMSRSLVGGEFRAKRVLGLDAAKECVEAAEREVREENVEFRVGTVEELVEKGERFDLVCALEVIEHVEDPRTFLGNLAKLCKGVLVISTIDKSVLSWALAILAAERVAKLVPAGTHDWRKFVRVSEIEEVLVHDPKGPKMHTEKVFGLLYNPIYGTWSYTDSSLPVVTKCNYVYVASR